MTASDPQLVVGRIGITLQRDGCGLLLAGGFGFDDQFFLIHHCSNVLPIVLVATRCLDVLIHHAKQNAIERLYFVLVGTGRGVVIADTAVVGQFAIGKVWASTMLDRNLMADVSVFYDRGWARLQQNPTSGVTDNTSVRAGWGVEAKVSQKGAFVLRAFWAKGLSGDSSVDNKEDRVGLSLSMAY